MSVERLPGGGWRARWRDASGRPRSKGSKRWTKKDALAYERRMLAERDSGLVETDLTVAELADMWLDASRHLAPRSRALYREQLDNDILPFLGDKKVSRVKPSDLDAYLAHLQRQGRAVSTQRRHLSSILSGMFSFAVKRQMIAVSPTKAVRAPRLDDGERRFLSMGELRHLASCFPPQWQGMILFTGIMGPRWSEVWALRPEHVSPDGRTITIPGTKTRAARRRVTMPEVVRSVVAGQLWFWATPESLWGPVTSPEAWRATVWRRALAKSGLAPLRFHDLRHTAAALAIHAGANPVLVQRRLGHANITVTLGTYGHLFPEADESVVDALDDLWQRELGAD